MVTDITVLLRPYKTTDIITQTSNGTKDFTISLTPKKLLMSLYRWRPGKLLISLNHYRRSYSVLTSLVLQRSTSLLVSPNEMTYIANGIIASSTARKTIAVTSLTTNRPTDVTSPATFTATDVTSPMGYWHSYITNDTGGCWHPNITDCWQHYWRSTRDGLLTSLHQQRPTDYIQCHNVINNQQSY